MSAVSTAINLSARTKIIDGAAYKSLTARPPLQVMSIRFSLPPAPSYSSERYYRFRRFIARSNPKALQEPLSLFADWLFSGVEHVTPHQIYIYLTQYCFENFNN